MGPTVGPLLLTLLSALVCANINIKIKASPSRYQISASHEGTDLKIITDAERATFDIRDKEIKAAVANYTEKTPKDVFVKSPTPWGDLYKSYDWIEMTRNIRVKSLEIVEVSKESIILAKVVYNNNSTIVNSYKVDSKAEVDNKIGNTFIGGNLTAALVYDIDLVVGLHPSENEVFVSHLNNNTVQVEKKTFKAVSEVKFTLNPFESAESYFNVTKVTVKVLAHLETRISGDLAVNYNPKYNNHHFWSFDVKRVLNFVGKSCVRRAKDLLTIEYYSDGKVQVVNPATGVIIKEEIAEYV